MVNQFNVLLHFQICLLYMITYIQLIHTCIHTQAHIPVLSKVIHLPIVYYGMALGTVSEQPILLDFIEISAV